MAPTLSKPSKPVQVAPKDHSLTNLRTSLTVLTILHHTSIPYGGLGSWAYTSPLHASASSPTLVAFNAVNHIFFIGTFFYLSGLLTSQSLTRKIQFLSGRWWRLGVPRAAYSMIAPPAQTLIMSLARGQIVSGARVQETFMQHVKSLRSVRGPLWFNTTLLTFDTTHSLFRRQFQNLNLSFTFPQAMILDILANFLTRLVFPLGRDYTPLSIELGYAPQYIASYILGTRSSSSLNHLPTKLQRKWLLAASISSGLALVGLLHFFPEGYQFTDLHGGMNLLAASYAIWNETTEFLIVTYLLDLFKRKDVLRRQWGNLGLYQYAAFLVHPVILGGVQAGSNRWKVGSEVDEESGCWWDWSGGELGRGVVSDEG
ncbi:uncharacterized protein PAC_07047 [Phialocephala subalpina]|uniref:Acyltransferase 3 domain-containing protein n=1 Tax=Phialocephala subalpina TaxID=576137 RepID=A0A1L7WWK4_9HELO|nr:uncharacterized protein PAC_07047 [Phialocephala subalpina]